MRQIRLSIFLTMLLCMFGTNAYAHDIAVQNAEGVTIYYLWNDNKTELIVSFKGNRSDLYSERYKDNIIIPETVIYEGQTYRVTSIGKQAFQSCRGLTSIVIPNSVTSIGSAAFNLCSSLTSVTIGNSVTNIEKHAFYGCGLTSVTIPNSVKTIEENAFSSCTNLTSVHITDLEAWCKIAFDNANSNPLSFANHLFLNGEEIKDLSFLDSVTSIGDYAFCSFSGLTSATIPNSVTKIGNYAFSECSDLTSVMIGNKVETIGEGAFYKCSSLISVTIGNSVTSIGKQAFSTSGLTSVTIPNSVTNIENYAFCKCKELTSATIGNSVTTIGNGAFEYCSLLTSVTIGNSVTYIGDLAFNRCTRLNTVTSLNPTPPSIDSYTFSDYYATLKVPTGSKSAYQIFRYWMNFTNIVEIDPTGIQSITSDKKTNRQIYDLNGRKRQKPIIGINIIDGKKVVVK